MYLIIAKKPTDEKDGSGWDRMIHFSSRYR
jgi:hypothetical protein